MLSFNCRIKHYLFIHWHNFLVTDLYFILWTIVISHVLLLVFLNIVFDKYLIYNLFTSTAYLIGFLGQEIICCKIYLYMQDLLFPVDQNEIFCVFLWILMTKTYAIYITVFWCYITYIINEVLKRSSSYIIKSDTCILVEGDVKTLVFDDLAICFDEGK